MSTSAERFDSQAATFDDRAGLAPDIAQAVAESIVELSGAERDDLVLEIGAGTGEIGIHLLSLVEYIGLDRSARMLDVFRGRLREEDQARVQLVHGDADGKWPASDATAAAVFGSRVMHLLDPAHLEGELGRVLRPGGVFLVGRVVRDRDSVRGRLRQQRQRVLKEHGVKPRQAEKLTESLLDRLVAGGAEAIEPRSVASWPVTTTPAVILDQWSALTSMGGVELTAEQRASILGDVRGWAEQELGDLGRSETATESYRVTGVRIGGTPVPASV